MQCPNCGLINPPESITCDCGYSFGTRQIEEKAPPVQRVSRPTPSVQETRLPAPTTPPVPPKPAATPQRSPGSDGSEYAVQTDQNQQPSDGTSQWRPWAIGGLIAATVLLAIMCYASTTSVESCHYDEFTNLSIIIEGDIENSRSRTVVGNACR